MADRRRRTGDPMSRPPDLAVVGNGRVAALVNTQGQIVWWCFPRFDSDPVFCRLIAGDEEKGFCDVLLDRHAQYSATPRRRQIAGPGHYPLGAPALARLTTMGPLPYIEWEPSSALPNPLHLVFGPDGPFRGAISPRVRNFRERTRHYW